MVISYNIYLDDKNFTVDGSVGKFQVAGVIDVSLYSGNKHFLATLSVIPKSLNLFM